MKSIAVVYFSATGTTARVAKILAEAASAPIYEILPARPYTHSDLNWNNAASRSSTEMKDAAARPAIASPDEGLFRHDTLFLGFPIWWYEAPRIIQTFLESGNFTGKTIIPFATSGGSGLGATASILQQSAPTAHFLSGKRLSAALSLSAAKQWISSLDAEC